VTSIVSQRLRRPSAWVLLVLSAGLACAQTGGDAKILVMTGQVSLLRDGATWALNSGDLIHPDQWVVTGPDGYAKFRVADGSTFEVFQSARVAFRNNRGDWRDLLEVFLGKVKVSIEHLGGANPNSVRTPTAVIAVRGTVFDIDVEDADATTFVLCEEGRVEVSHLIVPGSKILNPGEYVRVFKNMPLQAKVIDRGAVYQRIWRAASDALNEAIYRTPRGTTPSSTGTAGSGGTSSGDKNTTPTPTGAPPAPPPPPPAPPD
jgi:ferric-dicitrate binding protein FerR (iron transport regulator)